MRRRARWPRFAAALAILSLAAFPATPSPLAAQPVAPPIAPPRASQSKPQPQTAPAPPTFGYAAEDLEKFAYVIEHYDVALDLAPDSTLRVIETLHVTFNQPRHGLIRSIPVVYFGALHERFELRLKLESVTDLGGSPITHSTRQGRYDLDVRIGDADKFLTGPQVFRITYTAMRVLLFDDHDHEAELYWNLIGTDWDVPILSASATVALPAGLKRDRVRTVVFAGTRDSREQAATWELRDKTPQVSIMTTQPLRPGQGLTVALRWPDGIVYRPTWVTEAKWLVADNPLAVVLVLVPIALVSTWAVRRIMMLAELGRHAATATAPAPIDSDHSDHSDVTASTTTGTAPITDDLTPPENLSPLEIGTLIDGRPDPLDIVAQIAHLAQRGYLVLSEPATGDTEIRPGPKARETSGLSDVDRQLVNELGRKPNGQSVTLLMNSLNQTFAQIESKTTAELKRRQLLSGATPNGFVFRGAVAAWLAVIIALAASVGVECAFVALVLWTPALLIAVLAGVSRSLAGIGLAGVFAALGWAGMVEAAEVPGAKLTFTLVCICYFSSWLVALLEGYFPSASWLTPAGARLLGRIKRFESALRQARTFDNATPAVVDCFDRLLPYALALGLADTWAARFPSECAVPNSWLDSPGAPRRPPFSMLRALYRQRDAFLRVAAYTPRTSSSSSWTSSSSSGSSSRSSYSRPTSGFSGGGRVGGGYGGGGGRSW